VGPPGSGKTSVGKALAKTLGWQFVDLDQRIEAELKTTVQQLFSQFGESEFRRLETEALLSLVSEKMGKTVVATGGGIVTREANFDLMKRIGPIVCLQADVETLTARLRGDLTRPLLATGGDLQSLSEKLTELMNDRQPYYSLPETTVTTDGLTPQEVAAVIVERLGMRTDSSR